MLNPIAEATPRTARTRALRPAKTRWSRRSTIPSGNIRAARCLALAGDIGATLLVALAPPDSRSGRSGRLGQPDHGLARGGQRGVGALDAGEHRGPLVRGDQRGGGVAGGPAAQPVADPGLLERGGPAAE